MAQSRVLLALAMCVILIALGSRRATTEQLDVRGTFSNFRYSREAGDLLGAEIKIAPVSRPYDLTRRYEAAFQGALQIAERAPSQIMIVDIKIDGHKISFVIPERYPVYGGGKFEGTLNTQAIKGRFTIGG
jgi:hypothetical protein